MKFKFGDTSARTSRHPRLPVRFPTPRFLRPHPLVLHAQAGPAPPGRLPRRPTTRGRPFDSAPAAAVGGCARWVPFNMCNI